MGRDDRDAGTAMCQVQVDFFSGALDIDSWSDGRTPSTLRDATRGSLIASLRVLRLQECSL